MIYEALIIDGTDLSDVVSCIETLDGLYNPAMSRGDNVVIPGVDGEVFVDKPYATNVVDFGLTLAGDTTAELNDSFRALKTRVEAGKKLDLERQISYSTGNESHFAVGELAKQLTTTVSVMRFGRTVLSLKILGGLWYANSTTEFTIGAGLTEADVLGEARTHRMTVTMPAGGTVTNASSGVPASYITLSNTATGADITVDVLNMTAVQSFTDVSSTLTWSGCRYPFQLLAGSNFFEGDGCTIDYYPAYL